MKKLLAIGASLGVFVVLTSDAAAQGRGHMIAYDQCLYDVAGAIWCDVFLVADGIPNASPDGSKHVHIGDGTDPAWSLDGSRLAFGGSREGGLFVLNLGDWSLTKILNGGASPTWSPDGTKLAIAGGELYVINADGSALTPITNNIGFSGQPAWSPDGARIAFDCEIESGNLDICSINPDGTGLVRLTSDPEADSGAAFSPDGLSIAFTKTSGQSPVIALMNADGSGMQTLFDGSQPAWSPDGMLTSVHPWQSACNADNICLDEIYVPSMHPESFPRGNRPAWTVSVKPVAWWFLPQLCDELTCTFDGSGSWGGNDATLSYAWNFGDGNSDTSPTPTHVYAADGTYSITLTVTDGLGVASTQTQVLEVHVNLPPPNAPPIASFTSACTELTCTVNGSASSDGDGTIASYVWNFGDGTTGSGATASHTYANAGTYSVTLTVTDDAGASRSQSQNVTAVSPAMHVGDLDRAVTAQGNTWTATVTIWVHASSHAGVSNATVTVLRNDGSTTSCITNANGQCVVSRSGIPKKTHSVTFTVTNVVLQTFEYTVAANHDPDGDSNGTAVTVSRP